MSGTEGAEEEDERVVPRRDRVEGVRLEVRLRLAGEAEAEAEGEEAVGRKRGNGVKDERRSICFWTPLAGERPPTVAQKRPSSAWKQTLGVLSVRVQERNSAHPGRC